jgi:hypothetical protein
MSILGVLRLRATSALSRDKSVRRSAQDDDFAGVSKKNTRKLALMGHSPGHLYPFCEIQESLRLSRRHVSPKVCFLARCGLFATCIAHPSQNVEP